MVGRFVWWVILQLVSVVLRIGLVWVRVRVGIICLMFRLMVRRGLVVGGVIVLLLVLFWVLGFEFCLLGWGV